MDGGRAAAYTSSLSRGSGSNRAKISRIRLSSHGVAHTSTCPRTRVNVYCTLAAVQAGLCLHGLLCFLVVWRRASRRAPSQHAVAVAARAKAGP